MIFATDHEGVQALLDDGTLGCSKSYLSAVDQEVNMAKKMHDLHSWESNAFMVRHHLQHFSLLTYKTALHGDPTYQDRHHCTHYPDGHDHLYEGQYFGFTTHPYETIFVKANRDINPTMIAKLTEWHDNMKYSSYDWC